MTLLHVCPRADWEAAARTGSLSPASQGFIHLCTPSQLAGVLERFFADAPPDTLVAVHLDPDRLPAGALRWELADDVAGERFPHLYAPLEVTAATRVVPIAS